MEAEKNPPSQNPLLRFTQSVDNYIEAKYQTPKDQKDARQDAMLYASSQLAWYKLEPFLRREDYSDEELQERNRITELWDKGIEDAIRRDWSGIRTALQSYIRSSSGASTAGEFVQGADLFSESSEKRATAFINLLNSI